MLQLLEAFGTSDQLGALKPFGAAALLVFILVSALLSGRKNRFEEDKELHTSRASDMAETRKELEEERALRRADIQRGFRYLDGLVIWSGEAHNQRHGRLNDRQIMYSFCRLKQIDPLELGFQDIPKLPEISELKEPQPELPK